MRAVRAGTNADGKCLTLVPDKGRAYGCSISSISAISRALNFVAGSAIRANGTIAKMCFRFHCRLDAGGCPKWSTILLWLPAAQRPSSCIGKVVPEAVIGFRPGVPVPWLAPKSGKKVHLLGVFQCGYHVFNSQGPNRPSSGVGSAHHLNVDPDAVSSIHNMRLCCLALYGRASKIMLNGVSVALRTWPNPLWGMAEYSFARPACAPNAA